MDAQAFIPRKGIGMIRKSSLVLVAIALVASFALGAANVPNLTSASASSPVFTGLEVAQKWCQGSRDEYQPCWAGWFTESRYVDTGVVFQVTYKFGGDSHSCPTFNKVGGFWASLVTPQGVPQQTDGKVKSVSACSAIFAPIYQHH